MTRRLFNLAAILLPWLRPETYAPLRADVSLGCRDRNHYVTPPARRCKCGRYKFSPGTVLAMPQYPRRETHSLDGCQEWPRPMNTTQPGAGGRT